MQYWLSLFTPATWKEFLVLKPPVCAFPAKRTGKFPAIAEGDWFLCYLIGKKKWVGLLEVVGRRYHDVSHIHQSGLFPIRFRVRPRIALVPEVGLTMESLEGQLSFFPKGATGKQWACAVRSSPRKLLASDAAVIISCLEAQSQSR